MFSFFFLKKKNEYSANFESAATWLRRYMLSFLTNTVIVVMSDNLLQHPPLSAAPVGRRGCYYGELVNAANVDVYTLSADPSKNGEWLQPDFTIHGFRHVEISGLDALGPEVSHGLQLQSIWIVPTAAVS